MLTVAVIGSGRCDPDMASAAEDVGRELARQGATLVCGGLGGVMEAACRGAKAEGGLTIGILPGDHAADANPHIDIRIPTGLGEARNCIVVRSAQAVIAVGGEYGTLSEIAFALRFGLPVIGLRTWQLARDNQIQTLIHESPSPVEAVDLALQLVSRGGPVS